MGPSCAMWSVILAWNLVTVQGQISLDTVLGLVPDGNKIYVELDFSISTASRRSGINNSYILDWQRIYVANLHQAVHFQNNKICSLMDNSAIAKNPHLIAMVGSYSDLWIFRELLSCTSPSIVAVQVNPMYAPTSHTTSVPNCHALNPRALDCPVCGASLRTFQLAALEASYELVAFETCNMAYFIKRDIPRTAPFSVEESIFDSCATNGFCSVSLVKELTMLYGVTSPIDVDVRAQQEDLIISSCQRLVNATIFIPFNLLRVGFPNPDDDGIQSKPFYWTEEVCSQDGSVDEMRIISSLGESVRNFLDVYRKPLIFPEAAAISVILEHANRLHPSLFNHHSELMNDMSGRFGVASSNSGSDKFWPHGYYRFYTRYIDPYRQLLETKNTFSMLEIGIHRGNSLLLWESIFPPSVFIFGIDNMNRFEGERHLVFKADQSILEDLIRVHDNIKNSPSSDLFFIVDDGSHLPWHQILTFDYFFSELLLHGGTYVIEDIETSYWRAGLTDDLTTGFRYGYRHEKSAIEIFKALADDVNYEFLNPTDRIAQDKLLSPYFSLKTRQSVSSLTFGHNCIVVVKKSMEERVVFTGRRYLHNYALFPPPGE